MAALVGERNYVSRLARSLGISRALLQVHLRKLEAAGLVSATIEVSEDGKAMKFYEVTPFVLHLTPEAIADAARTLGPESELEAGGTMKPRSPAETGMLCLTGLIALALLIFGVHTAEPNGKSMVWLVLALSLGAGMVALARALMSKRKSQAELTGGEQYRALAEEYRRLADLAITAQEHTDLKLGDVSAQLDHLRDQTASLQKILKEVE